MLPRDRFERFEMTTTAIAITQDASLIDLIDSIVRAVDLDRRAEIDRLREALEPFDAVALFNDELRLNGSRSTDTEAMCFCEVWL